MTKSEYSKKLEQYAAGLPDAHEAFVVAMGLLPQDRGFDRELWEWVEANNPTRNELSQKHLELSYGRKTQGAVKERQRLKPSAKRLESLVFVRLG